MNSDISAGTEGKPKWMTWDDKWVEEVRRGVKACAVFVWYPIYCMLLSKRFYFSKLTQVFFYQLRARIQPTR